MIVCTDPDDTGRRVGSRSLDWSQFSRFVVWAIERCEVPSPQVLCGPNVVPTFLSAKYWWNPSKNRRDGKVEREALVYIQCRYLSEMRMPKLMVGTFGHELSGLGATFKPMTKANLIFLPRHHTLSLCRGK